VPIVAETFFLRPSRILSVKAIIVKNLNHAVEVKILNFPSCFITLYISCEDSLKCLFKIKANVNYREKRNGKMKNDSKELIISSFRLVKKGGSMS
jgi:hypothetical protein